MYTSEKRLYVTADRSRVVDEDDPEAAYLLVGEGGELDDAEAKKYGLKAPAKMDDAPADDEKAQAPVSNKARKAAEDK